MILNVYFADKTLRFTDEPIPRADAVRAEFSGAEGVSRAKILKFFETCDCVEVFSPQPEQALAAFARQFRSVEAAGGVVCDPQGRALMIFRNGRWDLPKGHWEPGETIEQCALREVEEETGVRSVKLGRLLCCTLHCYELRGRWEIKRTHWYAMTAPGGRLKPQHEEGIRRAEWCPPASVDDCLKDTFPTIRCVMEALRGR